MPLRLNFTPNTLGCHGLILVRLTSKRKNTFTRNEKYDDELTDEAAYMSPHPL